LGEQRARVGGGSVGDCGVRRASAALTVRSLCAVLLGPPAVFFYVMAAFAGVALAQRCISSHLVHAGSRVSSSSLLSSRPPSHPSLLFSRVQWHVKNIEKLKLKKIVEERVRQSSSLQDRMRSRTVLSRTHLL